MRNLRHIVLLRVGSQPEYTALVVWSLKWLQGALLTLAVWSSQRACLVEWKRYFYHNALPHIRNIYVLIFSVSSIYSYWGGGVSKRKERPDVPRLHFQVSFTNLPTSEHKECHAAPRCQHAVLSICPWVDICVLGSPSAPKDCVLLLSPKPPLNWKTSPRLQKWI